MLDGVGAPPDEPSWGGMLNASVEALEKARWVVVFRETAISLTVFGLNLLCDTIRNSTDPKLRSGRG